MGRRTDRGAVSSAAGGEADHDAVLLSLLDWTSRQPEEVELELACSEHPDPGQGPRGRTVVALPFCLERLAAHLLLELLVAGADSVTVALDGCAASEVLRDRYRPLVGLLAQLGQTDRLHLRGSRGRGWRRPVLAATSMPVSRRQLFFLPEAARRPLPDITATAHQRLKAAVRVLAGDDHDSAGDATPVPDGPALRLTSRGCTACGVCVQACPEQALSIEVDAAEDDAVDPQGAEMLVPGAETALWMRPSSCSGCHACVDVCPADALSEQGHHGWDVLLADSWVALESFATVPCRRCGGRFPAGGSELCPVCAFRSADPFGTTLPPHMLARLGPEATRRLTGHAGPT